MQFETQRVCHIRAVVLRLRPHDPVPAIPHFHAKDRCQYRPHQRFDGRRDAYIGHSLQNLGVQLIAVDVISLSISLRAPRRLLLNFCPESGVLVEGKFF